MEHEHHTHEPASTHAPYTYNYSKLQKIFWGMCGVACLLWLFWDVQDSAGMVHSLLAQLLVPLMVAGIILIVLLIQELEKVSLLFKKSDVTKALYIYGGYALINIFISFLFPVTIAGVLLAILIAGTIIYFKKSFALTTSKAVTYFVAAQFATYATIEILGTIVSIIHGL